MKTLQSHLGRARWAGVVGIIALMTLACSFGPLADGRWVEPNLLFSLATVSAVACVIAATVLVALADKRQMAEIGLLGTMLLAASVMPLVHGLLTPGVIFDSTEAFRLTSFLTVPVAMAAGAPLLAPHSGFGRWAARHWRDWTLLALLGVFVLASLLVFLPDAVAAPSPTSGLTIAVTSVCVVAMAALSGRQMRFYVLGRRGANLVASISLAFMGVTALTPLYGTAYSAGFWWAHVAGAIGVFGACAGLAVTNRLSPTANDLLAPVLSRDPLVAFELGLSPIVHDFVSDIEAKDEPTRDHVVRTCELAMRVGERFRLSASDLRDLGLAAVLHDVGKIHVPDDILKKPARLTDDEYDVIKQHPADGEAMLAAEPTLASVAHIVRHHHERVDGGGYPDGLAGREIPLASRIIAACDALDAMTHDRQYRNAMPLSMAFAVLREHAGSQWDENVVDMVIAVVPTMPNVAQLDDVGHRNTTEPIRIPDDIGELLVAVDAEI